MASAAPTLPPAGLPDSPARRRALALGLLLVAIVLLVFGLLLPILESQAEAVDHEDRQRSLLARLERIVAQGPALRREVEALDADLAAPDLLLRAPSASQAAAQLQEAVRRIAEAEGIAIDSSQALAPVPQGPLLRVGLRVELRAPIEPLSRILQALDAHRPHLVIREAVIAAPDGRGEASGGRNAAQRLLVRLDVQGLARMPEGEGDARRS
jgi:Tfp pilus assembly protein PilO